MTTQIISAGEGSLHRIPAASNDPAFTPFVAATGDEIRQAERLREQQEALQARKHRAKPRAHAAASPATSPEPVAKAITDSPAPGASPSPAK